MPAASSTQGSTLHNRDTRTTVTTYTGEGTRTYNGSSVSYTGPTGTARTTTTAYDTTYHAFPTQVTNALGHIESAGYDFQLGTLTSVTDANNQTTTATYEPLWPHRHADQAR